MAQETDFSVFVGDLAFEVDDATLEHTFRTYYPSTRHAKVMLDPTTGRSRGFGFVRFSNEAERDRAITEMNGVYIGTKQVRVSIATQRKPGGAPPPFSAGGASSASTMTGGGAPGSGETDPNNTTLFIGGLSTSVSEAELHAAFSRCGEIVYTKIPAGKGCGFVQFVQRTAAEYALETMNGHMLGGMPIRVSWGKSSKPFHGGPPSAPHHPPAYGGAGYYGHYDPYAAPYGGYGYEAYGYGAYGMDPYAGYAAGYPMAPHGTPAGMAAAAAASAAAQQQGGPNGNAAVQPVIYDPLAPVNVEKLNMAYMHRHVPIMTGAYVRVPIAMPAPM